MDFDQIDRPPVAEGETPPNLVNYEETRTSFDWWSDAFQKMDWLPGGGLNNAYEAIDRHVAHGFGDKLASSWVTACSFSWIVCQSCTLRRWESSKLVE